MGDKPGSVNPLGQFRDEIVGIVKDTAKTVVNEPKKILEQALGGSPASGDGDKGIESIGATASSGGNDPQQKMIAKQMADVQKSQGLIALHRQRLQEEIMYRQKKKNEEEEKEVRVEQEEDQKEQIKIVQLQREDIKSAQLQGQTHGRTGSHEQGDKHKG